MARNPKFAVLEIDGEELEYASEYEPVSEDVYYDLGKADTVKDRIDNAALGYSTFFQYTLDRDLVIPLLRSLIVTDCIVVGDNCLSIEGSLEIT